MWTKVSRTQKRKGEDIESHTPEKSVWEISGGTHEVAEINLRESNTTQETGQTRNGIRNRNGWWWGSGWANTEMSYLLHTSGQFCVVLWHRSTFTLCASPLPPPNRRIPVSSARQRELSKVMHDGWTEVHKLVMLQVRRFWGVWSCTLGTTVVIHVIKNRICRPTEAALRIYKYA